MPLLRAAAAVAVLLGERAGRPAAAAVRRRWARPAREVPRLRRGPIAPRRAATTVAATTAGVTMAAAITAGATTAGTTIASTTRATRRTTATTTRPTTTRASPSG